MLSKTKNHRKQEQTLLLLFYINTYTTILEKESKLRKTAALSQSLQKCSRNKLVFCIFNLILFTVNTLRGVSDSLTGPFFHKSKLSHN